MKDRPIPKKPRRIMILSLLGILVLLFFFLPRPPKKDVTAPAEKVAAIPHAEEATRREEGQHPAYAINAIYPKLSGTSDPAIAERVNKDIASEIDKAVADLKQNMGEPPAELKDVKNNLEIRYEVAYLNASIFSVGLSESEYIAGAAHPMNFMVTMTYDLRTGSRIGLKDLFKKDSGYLKAISDYAIPALQKQLEMPEDDKDAIETLKQGAAPTAQNYQEFLIAKEGLVIVFNTYQVGPGVIGAPRVAVPYALLAPFTNPAGLLPLRGG